MSVCPVGKGESSGHFTALEPPLRYLSSKKKVESLQSALQLREWSEGRVGFFFTIAHHILHSVTANRGKVLIHVCGKITKCHAQDTVMAVALLIKVSEV